MLRLSSFPHVGRRTFTGTMWLWLFGGTLAGATAQRPASGSGAAAAPQTKLSPRQQASQSFVQTEAAFLQNHDRAAAEQGFRKVIQLDPGYAPAWFNLGVLAEARGDWTAARAGFSEYLRLAPSGPDAKRAKQQSDLLSRYIIANVSPEQAQRTDYTATIQRARVFLASGLFREAIAEAGRAQAADSSRWEAYAVVALCLARQGKQAQAAQFEQLALAHVPDSKRAQLQLILIRQIGK